MTAPRRVPDVRIRALNDRPIRPERDVVLYWMIASRRRRSNFGLQRATVAAHELGKPVVVLEALRSGYPWASDRLHRFVMDGMADHVRDFAESSALYHPWLERRAGEGRGLLRALADRACLVVTDDFPTFFLPRMVEAAGGQLDVRLEAVDSNGLLPMRVAPRTFVRAHDFRRFLHRALPAHLEPEQRATPDPLADLELPKLVALPDSILERWPPASIEALESEETLRSLPIDHSVAPSPVRGGPAAAERQWRAFDGRGLRLYGEGRNHPDDDLPSGLSPYLHFGHFSAHEILDRISAGTGWTPRALGPPSGSREGWWGLDASKEAFLDELVTWRELGFNMSHRERDHAEWRSLPDWARRTLEAHRDDPRPAVYSPEVFEAAETHDELWNAAQRQLVREGRIHNYLRMLWGKMILAWSPTPEAALDVMIHLNNKYALDGRDPNSYSGIFWVLGRYDRPWAPERPVFGQIRYMTSASTRKKLRVNRYLARWGA